jgi:hypothetical protein
LRQVILAPIPSISKPSPSHKAAPRLLPLCRLGLHE